MLCEEIDFFVKSSIKNGFKQPCFVYHFPLEAEYAYERLKVQSKTLGSRRTEFIPLILEKGYIPDGWLGPLLGARLYYTLHPEIPDELFNKNMSNLMRAIDKYCKPDEIDGKYVKPDLIFLSGKITVSHYL